MKKKLLFLHNKMVMGGLEKVLLNLINALGEDFEISLGLIKTNEGELFDSIPSKVNIFRISEDETFLSDFRVNVSTKKEIIDNIKNFKFLFALKIFFKKLFHRPLPYLKGNWQKQPLIPLYGQYDVAVCYDIKQIAMIKYCAEKVKAKHKVIWIHDDLAKIGFSEKKIKPWLGQFEYFFVNGKYAYNQNVKVLNSVRNNVKISYNVIDLDDIRLKANLIQDATSLFREYAGIKLVSVGTLTNRKGYDVVLKIAYKLKFNGIEFKWFIVGDGELFGFLSSEIERLELENNVYLLGNCCNPYVYINHADIIVHCARHESYCTVLAEARVLKKLIITTAVGGADELVNNGINGFIVKNDENEFYKIISDIIINNEKMSKMDLSYNFNNTDANNLFEYILSGRHNESSVLF